MHVFIFAFPFGFSHSFLRLLFFCDGALSGDKQAHNMRDGVGVDDTNVRGGASARGMGDQQGNSCCVGKEGVCHGAVQVRTSFRQMMDWGR